MITIKQLSKTVQIERGKKHTLLHNITLDVPSGSIFALLGPNGAGKTTLIKCIMGFMKTKKGAIKKGCEHIGYAPDKTQFFPELTGHEQMKLIYNLHKKTNQNIPNNTEELLKKVGLDPKNTTRVLSYSAGMKKRLGLAMSMIADPEFLIRDEPMAGVDPLGRITIRKLIEELKKEKKTLLFSTHILSDVEEVADNLAIINQGKLLHQGLLSDIPNGLEEFFTQKITETKKVN